MSKIIKRIALSMAILAGFIACTTSEDISPESQQNQVAFKPNLPIPESFASVSTKAIIGTPDPGKQNWSIGDKVMAEVWLYNTEWSRGVAYFFSIVRNSSNDGWDVVADGAKVVTEVAAIASTDISTKGIFVTPDALILPAGFEDCMTMCILAYYYAPGQQWRSDGRFYTLKAEESDLALNEYWEIPATSSEIHIGSPIGNIPSNMNWTSRTARIRVVAKENDIIMLTAKGNFYPSGGEEWLAEETKIFTTTVKADAYGNAFFYGNWAYGATTIEIRNGDALKFKKIYSDPSEMSNTGITYVIDAR